VRAGGAGRRRGPPCTCSSCCARPLAWRALACVKSGAGLAAVGVAAVSSGLRAAGVHGPMV